MTSEIKYHPLLKTIAVAEKAFTQGNYQKAVSHYTQVIEDSRFSQLENEVLAACYLNRGMALRKIGHQQDALKDYAKAAELNPRSFKPHLNAALIYAQDLERYQEALVEFDKTIELYPTFTEAWSSRGLTKMLMDDLDGAEADLQTAIKLEPRHVDALCNLGNVYLKREQPEQAAEIYRRALEINPHDVEVRVNLTIALKQMGADRAAESVLREDKKASSLWRRKGGTISPGRFDFSLVFIRVCSPLCALVMGTTAMFMYGFTFHILIGAAIGAVLGTIQGFLLAAYTKRRPAEHWYIRAVPDEFQGPISDRRTKVEADTGIIGIILGTLFALMGAWILKLIQPPLYIGSICIGTMFGFGAGGWGVSRVFRKLAR